MTQNKTLPGSYINFVSVASASASLSERGIATMPLVLDWGVEGELFTVTREEFLKNSLKIFGYPYGSAKLKGLRDLFLGAGVLHAYRLNGGGAKASCSAATALYSGERGNAIRLVIRANADQTSCYDVMTYLDTTLVDTQTVSAAGELKANDFVVFRSEYALEATAGMPLTGGTNGEVDGNAYQDYLDKAEAFRFHTMGVVTTDETTKRLFAAYVKRMRNEGGVKFQLVLYQFPSADDMGVISVKNKCVDGRTVTEEKTDDPKEASLVYWVTGAQAGCPVNRSCQNMTYDGECEAEVHFTQTELADAMRAGEFVLHRVNEDIRVLADVNTMVTTTDVCGDIFKENQTVRVIDQLANDDAALFQKKYLGVVPNDAAGRTALWMDLVKIRQALQNIRAIENFSETDVTVEPGESRKSVVVNGSITIINAMSKLYMTVTVA